LTFLLRVLPPKEKYEQGDVEESDANEDTE
jgi:hypothetical protein